MGRNSGGYTIIEVMIVIAITSLLFFSALLVFHGEQGRVGFSQAMQDLSSKIQNYSSQISSATYPGSDSYSCDASGGNPTLQTPPNPTPPTDQCVFIGRAFQAKTGSNTLKGFLVIGSRQDSSGNIATDINDANPTLATEPGGGPSTAALEQDYTLENGGTIKSSTQSGTPYELVGLYDNLQASSGSATSAGNNILLKFYNCAGGNCNNLNKISNCISGTGGGTCGSSAPVTSPWKICIQSGSQTAELEVDNTSAILTTKVNYNNC